MKTGCNKRVIIAIFFCLTLSRVGVATAQTDKEQKIKRI
jgi:hypothetical protein